MNKFIHYPLLFGLVLGLIWSTSSCKKSSDANPITDVRDSVYAVSQKIYLWNSNLPNVTSFNPTSYQDANSVMTKVRTYSPMLNGANEDRWSFALTKTAWDAYSAGSDSDIGLDYKFLTSSDLRVKLVYPSSPAGLAGVKRGWKVLTINGVQGTDSNTQSLNTELAKSTINLTFEKLDGTRLALTLTAKTFTQDYILNQQVFTINNKKVGYFVFDSFLGDNNGEATKALLNTLFTYFKQQNITDLIVDLRYNGGGYGVVSEHLANLIAPSAAIGKVFVKTEHNTAFSQYNNVSYFKAVTNSLNLSTVTFITTSGTASASEELINGLRPVMNVKLIGATTHGKPVGYYAIPTMDYYAFPVAFKNINSVGYSDFFAGFTPDKVQTDDISHDLGDPAELCLSTALAYYRTGTLANIPSAARIDATLDKASASLNKERLHLLIKPQIKQ